MILLPAPRLHAVCLPPALPRKAVTAAGPSATECRSYFAPATSSFPPPPALPFFLLTPRF
jgi:hypothetical protein